jgi:hypothetical protein
VVSKYRKKCKNNLKGISELLQAFRGRPSVMGGGAELQPGGVAQISTVEPSKEPCPFSKATFTISTSFTSR